MMKSSWTVTGAVGVGVAVGSSVGVGTGVGIGVGFGATAGAGGNGAGAGAATTVTVGSGVGTGTGVAVGEDNGVWEASMVASISEGDGPPPPQATTAKTKAGRTINFQEIRSMTWIIDCTAWAVKQSTIKRMLAPRLSVVDEQEFHELASAHAHNRNFQPSNKST